MAGLGIFKGVWRKMSKWKPNRNDYYYFPFIHGDVGGPMPAIWQDSEIDNERYKMGVVCRTQSETVELARKMLDVAKGACGKC